VRVRQCGRNFTHVPHSIGKRQLTCAVESCAQRLALDKWHREIRTSEHFTSRKYRDDVRMLEFCGKLYLAPETVGADPGRYILGKNLYYNAAIERGLGGEEYTTHSSATKFALYRVRARNFGIELVTQVGHSGKSTSRGWGASWLPRPIL
jgi:hypothetical protein